MSEEEMGRPTSPPQAPPSGVDSKRSSHMDWRAWRERILRSSNRKFIFWVGGLAMVGLLAWLAPDPGLNENEPAENLADEIRADSPMEAQSLASAKMFLFLPDRLNLGLVKIPRQMNLPAEPEEKIKSVLEVLLGSKESVNTLFPEGMVVRGAYIHGKTAYISIGSTFRRSYNVGAWTELLAIHSIVNTVCANFANIKEVKILIDDKEEEIFAAHGDIGRALAADYSMILDERLKKSVKPEKLPDQGNKSGTNKRQSAKNG